MTDTQTEVTNPLVSYAVREDGVITVYLEGEGGATFRILFSESDPLVSATAGLLDAVHVRDIYDQEGFDAALTYIEADETQMVTKVTDDDINDLLKGE